jgi:arylsulfatase A-like enzyme
MPPNILLVILDSVRARNTSLYGYERNTTPFLTDFGREATVYEQARAPGIHSIASHASIFTGLHVEEHRLTDHEAKLASGNTIWEELHTEHGYETGLFTPNVIVTESSNLSDAFETVVGPRRRTEPPFPDALNPAAAGGQTPTQFIREALGHPHPFRSIVNGIHAKIDPIDSHAPEREAADIYTERFLDWQSDRDGPWAACINFMDAHYPYRPKTEYDEWGGERLRRLHDEISGPLAEEFLDGRPLWQLRALSNLYDGCIRQIDAQLDALVHTLKERDCFEDTLLVVTSDHGEAFGERSEVDPETPLIDHSWGIHEVLTHIPFVVKFPGQQEGTTIEKPTTLTEFPELVRAAMTGTWDGTELNPSEKVIVSTYRLPASSNVLPDGCERQVRFFGPWRAVYEDVGGTVRKYASRGDQSVTVEVQNAQTSYRLSEDGSDRVKQAFSGIEQVEIEQESGEEAIDEAVEEKLENLGYLR